jgi:hypothetical protein
MIPRLTVWPPARQGLAAASLAIALATSVGAAVYADGPWTALAALAHAVAALWALADARVIATQVGTGVAMAWTALIGTDGTAIGAVVIVAGVVATSEMLAATSRLGIVVERDPGPELRQVGVAVALGAVTSGVTLAASALPGPPGLIAPAVATLGCVVLAVALRNPGGRDAGGRDGSRDQR